MRRAMGYFWKIGLVFMVVGGLLSVTAIGAGAGRRNPATFVDMEETTYEDIRGLVIEVGIGRAEVRQGDGFSVSGKRADYQEIEQEVKDGILYIKEKDEEDRRLWSMFGFWLGDGSWNGADLLITIPEDAVLDELEVSAGVGRVYLEEVTVDGEAKIRAGAGQAELVDFSGNGKLSLDCGVGEISCQGRFNGEADLECGVGSIRMELDGREEDYGYKVEGGIGSVQVGSQGYGGIGSMERRVRGKAENQLDIQCGVGEVVVTFASDAS
ncbi:MAG: hypothetical protein HFI93_05655 [Lachnospiraceae bacterium]|nr:hypothetical protein [Lachnospiraceae bacterium]